MKELNIDGMSIAPGVVETIISIAVSEVEGVAAVGGGAGAGLLKLTNPAAQGIDMVVDDQNQLKVSVRVSVKSGRPLPQIAADIREAVSDAVGIQVGLSVSCVDVYIDAITFED